VTSGVCGGFSFDARLSWIGKFVFTIEIEDIFGLDISMPSVQYIR